jgi:hypothetical protein
VSSPNPVPQIGTTPPKDPTGAKPADPKPGGGVAKANTSKEDPKLTGGRKTMAAQSQVAPPPPAGPVLPQHERWFPIPGKYANPETSGVVGEAVPGGTRADIRVD